MVPVGAEGRRSGLCWVSMEVVTGGIEDGGEREGFEGGGVEGGLAALRDLETPVGEEEARAGDGVAVELEGVAGDEEVGDAGFIFQGQEAMALGGAGALAADDHPPNREGGAVGHGVEFAGPGGDRDPWAVIRGG